MLYNLYVSEKEGAGLENLKCTRRTNGDKSSVFVNAFVAPLNKRGVL